jgi:hypothetical protein
LERLSGCTAVWGGQDILLPAMSIFILDAVAQIVLPSAKRASAVSMMGRLPII